MWVSLTRSGQNVLVRVTEDFVHSPLDKSRLFSSEFLVYTSKTLQNWLHRIKLARLVLYICFPQIVSDFFLIFPQKLTICGNSSIFHQIVILIRKIILFYLLRITVISFKYKTRILWMYLAIKKLWFSALNLFDLDPRAYRERMIPEWNRPIQPYKKH